ncbi:MAG TPA: hypothetical protein VF097_01500 [Actinomycetota bacterium]
MAWKQQRLGPRLVEAARSGDRYRDVHLVLGGTGAVGGTAVLQLLSLYEEMFSVAPPGPDDVPVLVATGVTGDEISAFTRRLFRFVESRHGAEALPERVRRGYLTHSGVFVALERFMVTVLPALRRLRQVPPEERPGVIEELLAELGTTQEGAADAIAETVSQARPFSSFLRAYRDEHLDGDRFRSVVVGIPIPSLIAYHQQELDEAADHLRGLTPDRLENLKQRFIAALRDDLVEVQASLADEVLIAHTTGVGGMYDPRSDGGSQIRLGFAHAALDRALAEKARFAQELTDLYSQAGIKVLVTAAAIGIDEVKVRERVPLHRGVRHRLFEAPVELFPGAKASQPRESKASRRAGRPVPAAQHMRVFPPITVPFDDPPSEPARFEPGDELAPTYTIRSGENGFFSVADAESLYRVMKVASASELGLLLATVGLLGDDPSRPWFEGNVCYYGETDNSRQVFDFLSQPTLRRTQLSGLEPMSLQDLGSAKHQGELHTLALLILLHRLRTLDVDAIDPYVDLERFDPRAFFEQRSRTLTFEQLALWEPAELLRDMQSLAAAESPDDLLPLAPHREHELFPRRAEAVRRVLAEALKAVWTGPSLGLPILYERDGASYLRTGYYVAPLDLLVTDADAVAVWMRKAHAESGNPAPFEDFRDYHLAVGGFVDVRPHAIVCSAKSDREDLTGRVARFTDEQGLRDHLRTLQPYSFFSTCGMVAVLHRLRALYGLLRESMLELGTLHEWRWSMPRDAAGHMIVLPGAVEALRMVAEGLEKSTGAERLDGPWGYERRPVPDRRGTIPGVHDR